MTHHDVKGIRSHAGMLLQRKIDWSETMTILTLTAAATLMTTSAHAMGPTISPFTEEAVARGIDYVSTQTSAAGVGFAFADLDGDGDPDIIVTGAMSGLVGVYENDGAGNFIDRSGFVNGIPQVLKASSVTAADYDGDNDLDLFFTQTALPDVLCRNDGNFQFTDVSAESGLNSPGAGKGAAWGDFNNDGWLDVYVPNRTGTLLAFDRDILYKNNGDGTFTDVSAEHGLGLTDSTGHQAIFFDYDRDGDCDLYLSNDGLGLNCAPGGGWLNQLHENVDGQFINVTEGSGAGICANSMGVAVGDLDGNGYPDLYATNTTEGNYLLLNNGDGTFSDETLTAGVAMNGVGWGANIFDYNNDGINDLYVADMIGPNPLYVGTGAWPMVNMGPELAVNESTNQSFCSAVADIDNDGDLDILLSSQQFQGAAPIRLYINHEGEKRNWVKLRVLGGKSNKHAVGAMLDVRVGTKHYYREVYSGTSWKSQDDLVVHIGLGEDETIDEISTLWPGGITRTVAGFEGGKTWYVVPSKRLGDFDDNDQVDLVDFVYLVERFHETYQPGCEIMDFDGDSDLDTHDFALFLRKYSGPLIDCDGNARLDLEQILTNPDLDMDQDGVIDSCVGTSPADINGDGNVDGADLAALLSQWGASGFSNADLNGDGKVDGEDLATLLANWT